MTKPAIFNLLALPACTAMLLLAVPAGAQPFTFSLVVPELVALDYGAVALADLDGDGDLDFFGTGNSSNREPFTPTTYVAWTGGEYARASGTLVRRFDVTRLATGLWLSKVAWLDFDRDGALDFVVAGTARSGAANENQPLEGITRLYRNTGGRFEETAAGLPGAYSGMVAVGDYDNDGDEDVLVGGVVEEGRYVTSLYRNQEGAFVGADMVLPQLAFGDAKWVDYDSDGDLDLALSGAEVTGRFRTVLYRNDGQGGLVEENAGLPGVVFSAMDWGDYDNDGDLDLALSGAVLSTQHVLAPITEVYRNDGGRFVRLAADVAPVLYGGVAWGDADSDGDLDLLVVGARDLASSRSGQVYRNDGGSFRSWLHIPGVAASSVHWGDFDGDNDLDIVATGNSRIANPLMRLYRNDAFGVNRPPAQPSGLGADVSGSTVALSWDATTDGETPAIGLSYNIRVGTAPGSANIVSAASDPGSGRRLVAGHGNAGQGTRRSLRNLAAGTYYWSVQAIDHSYKGSEFAEEGTFSITGGAGLSTESEADPAYEFSLGSGYPNPFGRTTTISFVLPEPGRVTLEVYNVLGSRVQTLVEGKRGAGEHAARWSADDAQGRRVGAGVYFVRLTSGDRTRVRRLVLAR